MSQNSTNNMCLACIQVRQHLTTTDMSLTTAPSHVVSAGGVSFKVPAGRPHWETRLCKLSMIWSFNTTFIFLGSPSGSAAHAYKGPARQSQCHTLLHSHTSGTSKVVCHALVVASTPTWSIPCVFDALHTCRQCGDTFDIYMQCVYMSTHTINLSATMKAKTQSATLIRLRP